MNKKRSGSKNNNIIVLVILLGVIIIAGILCFTLFEIVPSTRWEGPSREVRANPYYALEKWLNELNYPVRTVSVGNFDTILSGPEKIIFLETSCFSWNDEPAVLFPWLKGGGSLIISIDNYVQYQLEEFMDSLGIKSVHYYDEDDDTVSFFIPDEDSAENTESNTDEKTMIPDFNWEISFIKIETAEPVEYRTLVINSSEKTKLVKFEIGKGSLVFTGKADFLKNYSLSFPENSMLAAELFLLSNNENYDNTGVLFIRSLTGNRNFFGNIAERGNPYFLAASVLMLVITGFWMVIPSFGRCKVTADKPGKSLQERFLAEGRFLKKNYALGKYIEAYEKELEQRSRIKGETLPPVEAADTHLNSLTFRQFMDKQKILIEQLEKLGRKSL